jgi:cytochrome c oxidase assembly protein subunit 15
MALTSENLGFFYKLQQILCTILFGLIVLGAGVRLANAGLACPDWPFCFGKAVPDFNFQIFMEWIHRVIASVSGILALIVSMRIWLKAELRGRLGLWAALSLLIFGFQAFLGRQTVLELLRSETVASHLMGGYTLLAVNFLILLSWKNRQSASSVSSFRFVFILLVVLSFVQATLGGTVSSHYAGLACSGFPKCNGEWWPELSGAVAYQFIHRLGALFLILLSLGVSVWLYLKEKNSKLCRLSFLASLLVLLQGIIGVSMVMSEIHPGLSLAHSATSLSIFVVYFLGAYRAFTE